MRSARGGRAGFSRPGPGSGRQSSSGSSPTAGCGRPGRRCGGPGDVGLWRRALYRGVVTAIAFVGSLFGSFWAITAAWRNFFFDPRVVPMIALAMSRRGAERLLGDRNVRRDAPSRAVPRDAAGLGVRPGADLVVVESTQARRAAQGRREFRRPSLKLTAPVRTILEDTGGCAGSNAARPGETRNDAEGRNMVMRLGRTIGRGAVRGLGFLLALACGSMAAGEARGPGARCLRRGHARRAVADEPGRDRGGLPPGDGRGDPARPGPRDGLAGDRGPGARG